MIEIYVNTTEKLELRLYSDGVVVPADSDGIPTVTIIDFDTGDAIVTGASTTTESDGDGTFYSYVTAISDGTTCSTQKATWSYTLGGVAATSIDYIEYVQPYITPDTIRATYPELDDKTFDELKDMERTVRKVIEFYSGQTFAPLGRSTKLIYGRGSDSLSLPSPIYKLYGVRQENQTEYLFDRDSDGAVDEETVHWHTGSQTIKRKYARQDPFEVRAALPENLGGTRIFKTGRYYEIDADWGWEYVPNEVNQAAKLLIGDYFCSDSNYHFRGVDIVRSADWRMEFAHDPYETTGNTVADQLLARYKSSGLVVI